MNPTLLQSLINRVQEWFSQAQQKATDAGEVVRDIPEVTYKHLEQQVTDLPLPTPYRKWIQTTCSEAIAAWQTSRAEENSLVILAEPVLPLQSALNEITATLDVDDIDIQRPFLNYQRSPEPLKVMKQVAQALAPFSPPAEDREGAVLDKATGCRQVVVIPALEQCFLRCIHGWTSIEDLQKRIVQDRSRFWIIGCSTWAWAFLDRVCHIGAYLEQSQRFPKLSPKDLREWLSPLLKEAVMVMDAPRSAGKPKETGDRTAYWKDLADLSEGLSTIAAELWLRSVGIREEDLPQAEDAALAPGDLLLCLQKPFLPRLASLSQADRYLVHAVLLHGGLTQQQLAVSLGDSDTEVRSRVQVLRRARVLQQQDGVLTLRPGHFPRLRTELKSNNFLVGESS